MGGKWRLIHIQYDDRQGPRNPGLSEEPAGGPSRCPRPRPRGLGWVLTCTCAGHTGSPGTGRTARPPRPLVCPPRPWKAGGGAAHWMTWARSPCWGSCPTAGPDRWRPRSPGTLRTGWRGAGQVGGHPGSPHHAPLLSPGQLISQQVLNAQHPGSRGPHGPRSREMTRVSARTSPPLAVLPRPGETP